MNKNHPALRDVGQALTYVSVGSRLIKGFSWSVVGSAISQGLTLLASIVVARYLGKIQYGELGIIQSTLTTFAMFGGAGMGLTAIKYVAEFREKDPFKAGRILSLAFFLSYGFSAGLALAILFTAPYLARETLNAPHLVGELRIASLALFLNGINGVQNGALAGFEAFRAIALINFVRGLFAFPVMIVGTRYFGLTGAVVALGVVAMVGCVGSEWALRNQRKQSRVPLYGLSAFRESRLLFRYSLPSYFTGFIYPAVTWLTSAILVHQPLGYAEMGVFNAVNQWRSAILFLPTALGMPILTVLSNILGVGDVDRYRRAFILSMVATTLIALFPALLICIMSSIILAAYGPAFAGGSLVLVLLAITAVLNAPCSVIGSAFSSSGDMWTVAELNAIWAVVLVAIFLLFTKDLGALGMALAFVIAHVVHLVNSVVFYIRKDRHSVVLQTAHRGHELG